MKVNFVAVLAKADDGKVYPVALTETELEYVIALLMQLHNGKIGCLGKPLNFDLRKGGDLE